MSRATPDEIFEHLEVFERQLRHLAAARQHTHRDRTGATIPGECGGPPGCVKCGLLRRADRVADLLTGDLEILIGRVGLTNGGIAEIGVSTVREAIRTVADAPAETIIEALDGPETTTLL